MTASTGVTRLRAYRTRLEQSRRDDESGFTLIEVVVALTIVMIVFAALAAGLVISQKVQRSTEARTSAVQFAQKILSADTTGGWGTTGFCPNDPNVTTTGYNNEPTVILVVDTTDPDDPCSDPRSDAVPYPDSSNDDPQLDLTVGNQQFTYTNSITWALDPKLGVTSIPADQNQPTATDAVWDYKRVVVTATYTVNNVSKSVTQSTLLAPDPSDQAVPDVPGATNPSTCDLSLAATKFCGVSATYGYVGTTQTAITGGAKILTTEALTFTISADPDKNVDAGSAATVTFNNGTSTTSVTAAPMALDSTTYPDYPPFWKYTLPKGSYVLSGNSSVVFKLTLSGTDYTYTYPVSYLLGP